jgi:hypothetical protein
MAIVLFLSWVRVAQIYLPDTQRWLVFTYQDDWAERNAQSWWFAPHADFARMGQVALTPDNATEELRRAQRVLHYSSEVKVLRRARDAAALLGDEDLASHYDELIARRWPKAVEVKEKTH